MARDTRIFRVTYTGKRATKYCTRTSVAGMFTDMLGMDPKRPDIKWVHACNAEATSGWEDVTEAFRNPDKPKLRCKFHPAYKGKRVPGLASWNPQDVAKYFKGCVCWDIYAANHLDYPTHWDRCTTRQVDPAKCGCMISKKVFGNGNDS